MYTVLMSRNRKHVLRDVLLVQPSLSRPRIVARRLRIMRVDSAYLLSCGWPSVS